METKTQDIQSWGKRYGKPVTEEEYTEICSNLYGVFSLLRKWDKEAENAKPPP